MMRIVMALCLLAPSLAMAEPVIVSTAKIWDQAPHNAFTDLIRWHDQWYCTFRESEAHVGGDGKLRVIVSKDGAKWESAALLAEEGVDLRDPKLSITPDDRLMLVAGGSVYGGTKVLKSRQPRVAFSKDGTTWTPTEKTLAEGDWLWRVTWHDKKAYGVTYISPVKKTPNDIWKLRLVASEDGRKYETITELDVSGQPNETTLRFQPDGEMIALVRREQGDKVGWIGRSQAPYQKWTWHETLYRFGGPNFLLVPDKGMWAVNRFYDKNPQAVLAKMTPGSYENVLKLESGGDTSYAGLAWHDNLLWVSYYSSHEKKSSIYLAKIKLP